MFRLPSSVPRGGHYLKAIIVGVVRFYVQVIYNALK